MLSIRSNISAPTRRLGVPRQSIRLRRDFDVLSPAQVQAAAHDVALLGKTRREIPDWIADRLYHFNGNILTKNSKRLVLNDDTINKAFGYIDKDEDDVNWGADFRWISDFLKFANHPPKQRAHRRLQKRLTLIHLALAIEFLVVNPERRVETKLFAGHITPVILGRDEGRAPRRFGRAYRPRIFVAIETALGLLRNGLRSLFGSSSPKSQGRSRRVGRKDQRR